MLLSILVHGRIAKVWVLSFRTEFYRAHSMANIMPLIILLLLFYQLPPSPLTYIYNNGPEQNGFVILWGAFFALYFSPLHLSSKKKKYHYARIHIKPCQSQTLNRMKNARSETLVARIYFREKKKTHCVWFCFSLLRVATSMLRLSIFTAWLYFLFFFFRRKIPLDNNNNHFAFWAKRK